MKFEDYKVVIYRNQPDGWVAEIPSIPGCYTLMPSPQEAFQELTNVYGMIAEEHQESGTPMPADTTEIVHA